MAERADVVVYDVISRYINDFKTLISLMRVSRKSRDAIQPKLNKIKVKNIPWEVIIGCKKKDGIITIFWSHIIIGKVSIMDRQIAIPRDYMGTYLSWRGVGGSVPLQVSQQDCTVEVFFGKRVESNVIVPFPVSFMQALRGYQLKDYRFCLHCTCDIQVGKIPLLKPAIPKLKRFNKNSHDGRAVRDPIFELVIGTVARVD
jgi:hypothetical protein